MLRCKETKTRSFGLKRLNKYIDNPTLFTYSDRVGTKILKQKIEYYVSLNHKDIVIVEVLKNSSVKVTIKKNDYYVYLSPNEFLTMLRSYEVREKVSKDMITVNCIECGNEILARNKNMQFCTDCEFIKQYQSKHF